MGKTHHIPADVSHAFDSIAPDHCKVLLDLRALILGIASSDPRVGPLQECLHWGEPAYIPVRPRTGSTIRLGVDKTTATPTIFFNCKTSLVEQFRQQFGGNFRFAKNRAVPIDDPDVRDLDALKICIATALTYHLRKT